MEWHAKQHTPFLKTWGFNRAKQWVLSSKSPCSNNTWSNAHATQKSKQGCTPPQAADIQGEVHYSASVTAQLAHSSPGFGLLKLLVQTLFFWGNATDGRSHKGSTYNVSNCITSRFMGWKKFNIYPVFLFHYIIQHAFTVRYHIRTTVALAVVPRWQLTCNKTASSVPLCPKESSCLKPFLSSAAGKQNREHNLILVLRE